MDIHWSRLGQVTAPGVYVVAGIGRIDIVQEDIDDARKLNENCIITLLKLRSNGSDNGVVFQIIGFRTAAPGRSTRSVSLNDVS